MNQLQAPPIALTEEDLTELLASRTSQIWFQPLELTGSWLPQTLLLDNSIYKEMQTEQKTPYCFLFADCGDLTGQRLLGYRVFTLFAPRNSQWVVLVERGWLAKQEGDNLRAPDLTAQQVTINGLIVPKAGARRVLKKEQISATRTIQVVQSIKPQQLARSLNQNIYPHPVFLSGLSPASLPQAAGLANFSFLSPYRHWGYAAQWLIMAIALALLCFFASFKIERHLQ